MRGIAETTLLNVGAVSVWTNCRKQQQQRRRRQHHDDAEGQWKERENAKCRAVRRIFDFFSSFLCYVHSSFSWLMHECTSMLPRCRNAIDHTPNEGQMQIIYFRSYLLFTISTLVSDNFRWIFWWMIEQRLDNDRRYYRSNNDKFFSGLWHVAKTDYINYFNQRSRTCIVSIAFGSWVAWNGAQSNLLWSMVQKYVIFQTLLQESTLLCYYMILCFNNHHEIVCCNVKLLLTNKVHESKLESKHIRTHHRIWRTAWNRFFYIPFYSFFKIGTVSARRIGVQIIEVKP